MTDGKRTYITQYMCGAPSAKSKDMFNIIYVLRGSATHISLLSSKYTEKNDAK